jgi:signal transduction histidine kinase
MTREKLGPDAGEAGHLLDRSRQELDETLKEIRELARGIHPTVLSDRGLGAAVEALAQRAPLPVEVGEVPAQELPERVELAAYLVVSEALTNVAKHASATPASVGHKRHRPARGRSQRRRGRRRLHRTGNRLRRLAWMSS